MTTPTDGAGTAFVAAVLEAAGAGHSRVQVEAVLRLWAGVRLYIPRGPVDRSDPPAELARRLILAGTGARAAAEILRQRRGISARHARRLVRAAAAMRVQVMSARPSNMRP